MCWCGQAPRRSICTSAFAQRACRRALLLLPTACRHAAAHRLCSTPKTLIGRVGLSRPPRTPSRGSLRLQAPSTLRGTGFAESCKRATRGASGNVSVYTLFGWSCRFPTSTGFQEDKLFSMIIVAFHTTADAFGFEEAAKRMGLPGRLGTIPRTISAGCGFAWLAPAETRSRIEGFLAEQRLECEGVYEQ